MKNLVYLIRTQVPLFGRLGHNSAAIVFNKLFVFNTVVEFDPIRRHQNWH